MSNKKDEKKEILKRSELLFCYDTIYSNPNGDPLEGGISTPRLDEEDEKNIVTDVRLKRTIRDYLSDYKKENVFIQEIIDDDIGGIQTSKARANDFIKEKYNSIDEFNNALTELLDECIDLRLFGATIPTNEIIIKNKNEKITKKSITYTGPVQFRMGKSLNKVELTHIKGNGAFASNSGNEQKTFREEYVIPYSFICFYGIINEHAAQNTRMTNNDIKLLRDGLWNGTKNLITRSKFGQLPRLLLQIEYKEENYFIGDLDNKISIEHDLNDDKQLRNINQMKLNLSKLTNSLINNKDKIEKVYYKFDDNLRIEKEDKPFIDILNVNEIDNEEIKF